VEQVDQLEQLRSLRCRSYQGFLYSRPVPAKDFEALVLAQAELPFTSSAIR
jgi:EAL domain-containing protein (putative c-di-GMP-specific phosphodiesterase class I)